MTRMPLLSSGIFKEEIIVDVDFSPVVLAQLHLEQYTNQFNMNTELTQLHANILQATNCLLNGFAQPTIGSNSSANRQAILGCLRGKYFIK